MGSDTIYDFLKFPHQPYPAALANEILKHRKTPLIDRHQTPLASMGSCFAINVARWLRERDFNYIVTEPPGESSANWDRVFSTACIRQIVQYSFGRFHPGVRWWMLPEFKVQDPFRRNVVYPEDGAETLFEAHRKASQTALLQSQVLILTLGLTETWRDKRDGATFYRVPSPRIYDPAIHEFHLQTVQECVNDLLTAIDLLGNRTVILTVSPQPLFATFRTDVDVLTANEENKATLRAAAAEVARCRSSVHYFPGYELVTRVIRDPYEPDGRHVRPTTVDQVMDLFCWMFVREPA